MGGNLYIERNIRYFIHTKRNHRFKLTNFRKGMLNVFHLFFSKRLQIIFRYEVKISKKIHFTILIIQIITIKSNQPNKI